MGGWAQTEGPYLQSHRRLVLRNAIDGAARAAGPRALALKHALGRGRALERRRLPERGHCAARRRPPRARAARAAARRRGRPAARRARLPELVQAVARGGGVARGAGGEADSLARGGGAREEQLLRHRQTQKRGERRALQ